jgi:hypothetical protein
LNIRVRLYVVKILILPFLLWEGVFSQWQWAVQAGGDPGFYGNFGTAVRAASTGELFFTGVIGRKGAFDSALINADTTTKIVLGCYGANGERHWVRSIGDASFGSMCDRMAIDDSGTIYLQLPEGGLSKYSLTGDSLGSIAFDTIFPLSFAAGSNSLFISGLSFSNQPVVAKTDRKGSTLWQRSFSMHGALQFFTTTLLSNGDIVSAGRYTGNDAGDSLLLDCTAYHPKGGFDGFILCTDSSGKVKWSVFLGGPGNEEIVSLAGQKNGAVYAAGSFEEDAEINGQILHSRGGTDIVLLRFSPAGMPTGVKTFGSALTDDCCTDMSIDQSGKVWLTGKIGDTTVLDNRYIMTAGSCDAFIASFDTAGNPVSIATLGGTTYDQSCGIICSNNTVVITGYFSGSIQAGQTALLGQPSTCFDFFIASLVPASALPFYQLPVWQNGIAYRPTPSRGVRLGYSGFLFDLRGRKIGRAQDGLIFAAQPVISKKESGCVQTFLRIR